MTLDETTRFRITNKFVGILGEEDAAKLMDAMTAAMLKIKGDGRLAKIQKKWFGDSFDTPDSVPNPAL